MYLEIYIDVLFLINFTMDIILLIILKKVRKLRSSVIRTLLAAIAGGINGCIMAFVPGLPMVIKFIFMYIFTTYLMVRIAYRFTNYKELMKNIIMLFIITFFLGGFLNSLYYYSDLGYFFKELLTDGMLSNVTVKFFLLLSPVIFIGVRLFIKAFCEIKKHHNLYMLEVKYGSERLKLKGFYDTGNSLTDPVSGKPVAIAEYGAVKTLFPDKLKNTIELYLENGFLDVNSTDTEYAAAIRFIPYKSIGKENGMLIGIIFNEVIVHSIDEPAGKPGKDNNDFVSDNKNSIIAMHNGKLSNKEDYQVILHKELL